MFHDVSTWPSMPREQRLYSVLSLTNKAHTQCQECRDLAQKALMDTKNGLPPDSAKIRMLLKLLKDVEKGSGQKEKTIVFSQFTSFMNLIEPFLKAEGIRYVRCERCPAFLAQKLTRGRRRVDAE